MDYAQQLQEKLDDGTLTPFELYLQGLQRPISRAPGLDRRASGSPRSRAAPVAHGSHRVGTSAPRRPRQKTKNSGWSSKSSSSSSPPMPPTRTRTPRRRRRRRRRPPPRRPPRRRPRRTNASNRSGGKRRTGARSSTTNASSRSRRRSLRGRRRTTCTPTSNQHPPLAPSRTTSCSPALEAADFFPVAGCASRSCRETSEDLCAGQCAPWGGPRPRGS